MGVYLAPELVRRGFHVDITTRDVRKSGLKTKFISGDAHNTEFLTSVLENVMYDVIIDFMVYSTEEFKDRVDLLLSNTDQYVFLSTYRVFANKDKIINEKSPMLLDVSRDKEYLSTDEYALSKARQEKILRSSKRKNWTIVRPSITYSKERFQLGVLEADLFLNRSLAGKATLFPEEMLNKYTTMTWAGDVAKMIAGLVSNEDALGEDFNVVTAETHRWRDVIKFYESVVNLKLRFVKIDAFLDIYQGKYQVMYDRMYDRVMDNSKILKAVGMTQDDFLPLPKGIEKEVKTFIKKSKNDINIDNIELHQKMDSALDPLIIRTLKKIKPRTRLKKVRQVLQPRLVATSLRRKLRLRTRFKNAVELIRQRRKHGLIVTLASVFNYGNIIQRFALEEYLKQRGYRFDSLIFSDWTDDVGDEIYGETRRFINTYISGVIFDKNLKKYDNYIVGSDQVWRNWYEKDEWSLYSPFFLEFVEDSKSNKISYAASFGVDTLKEAGINERLKNKIRPLLKNFDYISVREDSGRKLVGEICQMDWSDVKVVIDPTLLLKPTDYSRIIDSHYKTKERTDLGIFCYILDITDNKRAMINEIKDTIGGDLIIMNPQPSKKYEAVETWLRGFRDAQFVVTDSFHGAVFSIINNTEFIVINNKSRGSARFVTLFNLLDISLDRIVSHNFNEDINQLSKIDWKMVNKKLKTVRKDNADWLIKTVKGVKSEQR